MVKGRSPHHSSEGPCDHGAPPLSHVWMFGAQAKVFAGTHGLPHVSAVRTAIVSNALSTTPRSDITGMDPAFAAGCLLDRWAPACRLQTTFRLCGHKLAFRTLRQVSGRVDCAVD